jgi:hypothetical protein
MTAGSCPRCRRQPGWVLRLGRAVWVESLGLGGAWRSEYLVVRVFRDGLSPFRLMPLVALVAMAMAGAGLAQEQPGCTMLDGQLHCAPGVGIAPLPRIPIVRMEARQRQDDGFGGHPPSVAAAPLLLQGRPQEGAWLKATVGSPGLKPLPDSAYHWYHKPPGRLRWELIPGASGPTYQLRRGDMAYEVMVLVAVPSPDGSQRLLSNPVGPVMALGARAP